MEIVSIILSVLALLFTGYTYFAHDKKLKEQERQLNDYQLRSLKLDEEENLKAVIRAKAVKMTGGKRTLYIYNAGKAKARNIIVEQLEKKQVYSSSHHFPLTYNELLPEAFREVTLYLCEGDDELTLNYTWDDDYQTSNKESQTIDL